ncbi:transmembrane protein 161B [Cucumis melo var. makuwa]|uniref:Transmembrane protein 161B n=1 Tax=Cucumis melo var. makuwa TaxID=1194695 RepID=A0A5D3DH40_CUCMM|nr:transmembrane protein 161B [Cucumis melo var. makuwa]
MLLQVLSIYKNLLLHVALSLSLSVFIIFFKIPSLFLHGIFTYIHPDNTNSGVRAAIRRPDGSSSGSGLKGYRNLSSTGGAEIKKRTKSKDKVEFDESKAQIFRLKLDENHLQTRIYFKEYRDGFTFSFVGISCLLLQVFVGASKKSGVWGNGIFVPLLFVIFAGCKLFVSLTKVAFEKSASRTLDRQLSLLFGVFGFLFGLLTCSAFSPLILDFDLGEIGGLGACFIAILMGLCAGFLFIPATKIARSFWLGTDQIRCNLDMVYCGWFSRMVLYSSQAAMAFTTLLWVNPLAEIFIKKNIGEGTIGHMSSDRNADRLVGSIGFSKGDFAKLRLWCLTLSAFLQIVAVRQNLQMFLNEALLSWYQRLHAGKVPDLDFSRAKQFGSSHENIRIVLLNFMNLIVQTNADRQTEYEMVFVAMVSTLHYDFSVVSFQSLPVQSGFEVTSRLKVNLEKDSFARLSYGKNSCNLQDWA